MKVLHLCPSFNNSIYPILCDGLIEKGVDCSVFSFSAKGTEKSVLDRDYVKKAFPFNAFDRLFFFRKENKVHRSLKSFFDASSFDLLHAHTLFTAGYLAYRINRENGTPYIVAVRSSDVDFIFKYRFYLRGIAKRILSNAKYIVFISPSIRKRLYSLYLDESEAAAIDKKSSVLPNGINDFWMNNSFHGHKSPNHNFIYYGDINKNKNIVHSCQAIMKLRSRYPDVSFTIIGPVLDQKVFKAIQRFDFVKFYPKSPKEVIIHYLSNSSIFIMPSFSETFGLTYIEAMTQGVPIIYSKNQGPDGYFDSNPVGCSVNPSSPDDIAIKISFILDNYSFYSTNCLAEFKRFSWSAIVDEYSRIYSRCMIL